MELLSEDIRLVKGKWDDNKGEQLYPQAEMDLIASFQKVRRRLEKAAQGFGRPLFADKQWLDVEAVRSVANDMVSLFVWEYKNVWRWDGVWIYPHERDSIMLRSRFNKINLRPVVGPNLVCMRNFLSVGHAEIHSAAEKHRGKGAADGN